MSQTLKLTNFSDKNVVDQTQLTAGAPVGTSILPVQNCGQNFGGGAFVLIGATGSKSSEMIQGSGTIEDPTQLPLISATQLVHNQFDPVYALFANQIRIYSAPDAGDGLQPPDTAFTMIDVVNIDPSDSITEYTDVNGGGTTWYKSTYYNSVSTAESDLGSSVAVRGNFTVDYCSIDDIRGEAGFRYAPYISDADIDQKRQAAQDEINGALDEFYDTPLQPPINDFLKDVTIRLAAGLLRKKEYSQITDPQVNGTTKYNDAQKDLNKLIEKARVLVNKQGVALDSPGATGGIEGWPNSSSATTPGSSGGAPRVFRMSDIQGQPMTNDSSGNPNGNQYYGRKW
jgi:hypothetical protein